MLIYLIGFMGSGKTTFGKKLAAHLNYQFIDLDTAIELHLKMSVVDIFKTSGETYFREQENQILQTTVSLKTAVISCGGGAPCYFDNMVFMNANGVTVYLNLSAKAIYSRLKQGVNKRPLLANVPPENLLPFIETKLAERKIFYEQAQINFDPIKGNVADLAKNLSHEL